MNWVAVEGPDNNFSIHPQRLADLSDLSILSLSNTLKNSYSRNSGTHHKYGISEIVNYFRSFPYFSNSTRPILPYRISDLLYNHISQDKECPIEFINDFFSDETCSLSSLALTNNDSNLMPSRITHLISFPLTALDFSQNLCVTDSVIQLLTNSNISHSLKTLKLRGCTNFTTITYLFCLTDLVHLDLSENLYLHWGKGNCVESLSSIISSLSHLETLDLHVTNLYSIYKGSYTRHEDSLYPASKVILRELYLHKPPTESDFPSPLSKAFAAHRLYRYVSEFPELTHLDLSGWPFHDNQFEDIIPDLSKKLTFFGLYETSITHNDITSVVLHSPEVTGLSEERFFVPTLLRYSRSTNFLKQLFITIFDNMLNKSIIYSDETILTLTPLVLGALDHYISLLPPNDAPSTWQDLDLLISCTACLYGLEYSIKKQISAELIRRTVETSVTLLHRIGVRDLSELNVGQLVANTCSIYSLWGNVHSLKKSHQTMHNFLCKFFLNVIDTACKKPELSIMVSNTSLFARILDRSLRLMYTLLFGLDGQQKAYVGIELNGVDILMRFIDMKLTSNTLDADLHHASGALMNITYLCLDNCLRLSKREHSDLLVRLLGEIPQEKDLVGLIMASIENIAEFCLQDESAGVSSQLLAPVVTVLRNHTKYNQDALSCAIAFTAYFSMGHEKWSWKENGDEALSLAVNVIDTLDYRIPRSVSYNTLDFLVECLGASDARIQLSALWIICNLVYKSPDYYIELLSEEAEEKIRRISGEHAKDSMYHKLSREVLRLLEITRKCAEFK